MFTVVALTLAPSEICGNDSFLLLFFGWEREGLGGEEVELLTFCDALVL